MSRVAVIGAGLIGQAWAMVFARAGWEVALLDAVPGAAERGLARIAEGLSMLAEYGLAAEPYSASMNRKSTRLNSSHLGISYAVFCLKKKIKKKNEVTCMH